MGIEPTTTEANEEKALGFVLWPLGHLGQFTDVFFWEGGVEGGGYSPDCFEGGCMCELAVCRFKPRYFW